MFFKYLQIKMEGL